MKHANQWAGGIALGAALAYVLDPDRGNRRRALIRDQMTRASRKRRDATGVFAEDSRNRLYGTVAALRSSMRSQPVDDDVLVTKLAVRSLWERADGQTMASIPQPQPPEPHPTPKPPPPLPVPEPSPDPPPTNPIPEIEIPG